MKRSGTVTVYNCTVADSNCMDTQMTRHSKFKTTRESIEAQPGAKVLEGTGQEVSLDELDGQGRYRRIATGWGELA
jgi:hypothetical protein